MKNKKDSTRILQRNSKSSMNNVNGWIHYHWIRVKLSDSQLNKLKSATKNQTGVTWRMNTKMFNGNNLPHELLLTTRQETKLGIALKTICKLI